MPVKNLEEAWAIAKGFLKRRGYGDMPADSLKDGHREDDLWHIKAKFYYWFEEKEAEVWVNTDGAIVKFKITP